MTAACVALADRVTGVCRPGAVVGPLGGAALVPGAAASVGAPSGAAPSAGSGADGTVPATASAGEASGTWGPAGASAAGGGAGVAVVVCRVGSGSAGFGLPSRMGRHTRPQSSAGASAPGVAAGVGSVESAAAGLPGKRLKAMARTAAAAVIDTTGRACEDGVITAFRCAQSPAAAFLVSPEVFYSRSPGRKSRAGCQCARRRFRPHQAKVPPPTPTRTRPAAMAGRSGPGGPSPWRDTEAAWVALDDRVTGTFQLDPDDGAPVAGVVATGPGVSSAMVSVAAGSSATSAAGTSAVRAGASGAGEDGAVGWGAGGWSGCVSSSGLAVLPGRGSSGLVAVGSWVQPSEQPGAVVAVPVGSGESARAGPPAGRPRASASTAADAVAETARSTGEDGVMDTFRCAQSPVCGFLVSEKSSTTRRRAANPPDLRPCGYGAS